MCDPNSGFIWLTIISRELYVWLEMVPGSGTDFRKVDAGAARYASGYLNYTAFTTHR